MKARNRKQEKRNVQSSLKVRLLVIGITSIGAVFLSGCQETSMTGNASSSNISRIKRIHTLAENLSRFERTENKTNENKEPEKVYFVGTQSYAEKLMSMYENSKVPTLNDSSNNWDQRRRSVGVPILMIEF